MSTTIKQLKKGPGPRAGLVYVGVAFADRDPPVCGPYKVATLRLIPGHCQG